MDHIYFIKAWSLGLTIYNHYGVVVKIFIQYDESYRLHN